MRILFVASNIKCPGDNGASTHVTEVVTRLRAQDDVLLVAHKRSTLPGTLARGTGLPPAGLRQLAALSLLARVWRDVRAFRPDIVYDRGSSFGLGSALGRLLRIPVVYMVLDGQRTRFALSTAARIITTLPALIPAAHSAKVSHVHWGANTDLFHPAVDGRPIRQRLGIPRDHVVVCYSGAFYCWHGLEELVAAAAEIKALPVTFLLVGAGERSTAIRQQVCERGLSDRFIFAGRVAYTDVPQYLAAADICVAPYQPSRTGHGHTGEFVYEPLKVFEYLAAGKPTITLKCEPIEQLFVDGRDLVMVRPNSASDLAAAIARLATDGAERDRLAHHGRAAVVARYDWDAHVTHLRSLFRELTA